MSTAAWADGEIEFKAGNTIGSSTEPGGLYYAKSEIFEIPANKTLTLKFKTYSATDAQLTAASINKWEGHMSHLINLWDGVADDGNIFWRADGYAWQTTNPEKNSNQEGWPLFLGANTRWGTDGAEFREDITGSDVVMTIARVGGELRMTQDFSATSGKYRRYFVANYGNANNSIWAQLTVERAYVTVSENYSITDTEVPAINGKQIGSDNNTTAFWTSWTDYFTIDPGKTFTLRYKLYTNRIDNYNGAVAYVTTNADRNAAGYTEYFGLRPDNWVNIANQNATECNFGVIGWNWATFREKLDGSTVTLTVTREDANVKIREEFAPADGSTTLYEEYNQNCDDGNQIIRVFLALEEGHLDLLSTSEESYQTINAYGWATYSSDKALDFSKATDGLTAYSVTGHSESALTLNEITTAVPANTGLLLKGTAGTCYTIPVALTNGTAPTTNLLKAGTGASVAPESGKTKYALSVNGGVACFKKIAAAREIPVGKAYLEFDEEIAAREFFALDESEVTGISSIENGKMTIDNAWYSLDGRKYNGKPSVKGVYVNNGRKVVLK